MFWVLLLVAGAAARCDMRAAEGDIGYCRNLKWGGETGLHFYGCCNNWNEGAPPVCDGTTYHLASHASYCASHGASTGGGCRRKGKRGKKFTCGGCVGQTKVMAACTTWLRNVPGFCWKFSNCFQDNCLLFPQNAVADTNVRLACGDGQCKWPETIESCALDCCKVANPVVCNTNATCTPECCGDSSCCRKDWENPPIGTIIDWWRPSEHLTDPLPLGYEVCDGGVVATPGSMLFNTVKPNMTHAFVMGVARGEVGTKGGSAHSTTAAGGSHAHAITGGTNEADNICGSCHKCHRSLSGCGHKAVDPPSSTNTDGSHTHTVSTLPPYVGLLKLIRVL
eukprot:Sspe_Gene.108582::Locus_87719_Transcript_2_2_Confidence_0.667_Length_1657::g.108582::m.108582